MSAVMLLSDKKQANKGGDFVLEIDLDIEQYSNQINLCLGIRRWAQEDNYCYFILNFWQFSELARLCGFQQLELFIAHCIKKNIIAAQFDCNNKEAFSFFSDLSFKAFEAHRLKKGAIAACGKVAVYEIYKNDTAAGVSDYTRFPSYNSWGLAYTYVVFQDVIKYNIKLSKSGYFYFKKASEAVLKKRTIAQLLKIAGLKQST